METFVTAFVEPVSWLNKATAAASGRDSRRGKYGRRKISSVVLGILVFGPIHLTQTGPAHGQIEKARPLSVDQLMARDCHLAPQQVIALVEEQLSKSLPGGALWGVAVDALTQSLTGCVTDPQELMTAAQQSRFFNPARSSNELRQPSVTLAFLKKDRTDDFNIVFNVCTDGTVQRALRCLVGQIRAVSTAVDNYRWP